MSDGVLRDIFSEVGELSKGPCFSGSATRSYEDVLRDFRRVLRLEDPKELNQLLNLLPNFGFFKNIFSEYLWCTPAYAKTMGFEHPEDLIGQTDLSLPWSFDRAMSFQELDEAVLLSALPTFKKEVWMLEADAGAPAPDLIVQMHRYPVFDEEGEVIGVFGVGKADVLAMQFNASASQSQAPAYC